MGYIYPKGTRDIGTISDSVIVRIWDGNIPPITLSLIGATGCASPDYLAKHGMPQHPTELSNHYLVAAHSMSPANEWRFAQGIGIKINPHLMVTNNDSAIEAVVRGLGMTRLLSYQIAPYVASGQIQTVLCEFEPKALPIHVIHREGRYASAKVRAFVDLLVARLRADKSLN